MKIGLWCILLLFGSLLQAMPNISKNRYATAQDAAHWTSVNMGDYIFFTVNNDIDWRSISFWAAKYDHTPTDAGQNKDGQLIPYAKGEIFIYYDADGNTKFFECLQDHAGDFDPNTSASYWSQLK